MKRNAFVALVFSASVLLVRGGVVLEFPAPAAVCWEGLLGEAIAASAEQRLPNFIRDETSVPLALFGSEGSEKNTEGRYWGEHVGKWLFTASRAAARAQDAQLEAHVRRIADYLISTQEPDGYIGTYPRALRFMTGQRTLTRGKWDVWVTAYVIMGLLEVNRHFPDERYIEASRRLADLCWRTFSAGTVKLTELSNHEGLSATILLEPIADLHGVTGEPRYLELARLILEQADEGFGLVRKTRAGAEVQTIATGKAYQLCWQFLGLATLHRVTGDPQYLEMARHAAESVRRDHLTLGGGPWGGIASHREVFNPAEFFSPYGFVETCSVMSWIQLNRELLRLTGEAGYAEEIERAAYNSLLGALAPNGEDWCYYTFPNGRRVHTAEMKCCKSSGAMALEELGPAAYAVRDGRDVFVNLYGPGAAKVTLLAAGEVSLRQRTTYPFAGDIELAVAPEKAAEFTLHARIPGWAKGATIAINGTPWKAELSPGTFAGIRRRWTAGDVVTLSFPMRPVLHQRTNQSAQDTNLRRDEVKVMQTVMRYDYVAITRGPLVYATELIDGFKREETLRLSTDSTAALAEIAAASPNEAPTIKLSAEARVPLFFTPWYATGGRRDGTWRLTWMQIASD